MFTKEHFQAFFNGSEFQKICRLGWVWKIEPNIPLKIIVGAT
jgi:hypothetical protein